jgi:radical SAM superfamily enzyme YgiQ (UPF0313 family)
MKLKLSDGNSWPLVRFIAPTYPEVNIFTGIRITPLGLVNIATAASKTWGWRVEIIDENNYRGPRDKNGLPDHRKLQEDNPAQAVGFYCGLTSTMDRVFELSKFYHEQGAINIAGGWHAHYCPEETLDHNFDIVVHGEGEIAIREILSVLNNENNYAGISGISFWENGIQKRNFPERLELPDLSDLPFPDFGLIRYAKKIKTYPVGRVRGCSKICEFCSVKGEPRWANPEYVFNTIKWLEVTRGAKRFFIIDDRLEENPAGLLALFKLINEEYGNRLKFTVQIRLETARNTALLEAMSAAGVRMVCIGYESPIAEDLNAMHKGLSAQKIIEWTLALRRYFWVHGMFIFGYPTIEPTTLSVPEMVELYKSFIRKAKISSIQILHPVPIVGTELRARLEKEGRIFPPELVPWSNYDGNFACFQPNNMSLQELQDTPIKLMKWFYSRWSLWRIPYRTVIFPVHYLIIGWHQWHDGWLREVVKYGGHRIVVKWLKRQKGREFVPKLEDYKKSKSSGL